MMKKCFKVLLTAVFAMTLCLSLFMTVNTQTAKADGESYILTFETGTPSADCAAWTAGWWSGTGGNNGHAADGTCSTVNFTEANTVYYLNSGNFSSKQGKTYKLTIEAKAEKDEWYHLYQLNEPNDVIKTDNHAGTDWIKVEAVFTAIKDDTIIFIYEGTGATVQFKNMIITEVETKTLTAGAVIGTLPEVPAKEDYDGYWAIDGKKITAESVYDYSADKTAVLVYERKTRILDFHGLPSEDLTDKVDGWWSQSGSNNGLTISEDDATVDFVAAGGTVYVSNKGIADIKKDDKYIVSLEYKKISGKGKFHLFYSSTLYTVIKEAAQSNEEWQSFTVSFTATDDSSVFMIQEVSSENNDSTILFRNFTVTHVIESKDLLPDAKIGELPELPEKTGYTAVWTIDGVQITPDTVFEYAEDKIALPSYKANKYTLTFGEGEDATEIEVFYGSAIGTLPQIPAKTGHTGHWTVNDIEITAETVYYETDNATAKIKYEANKYTLTLGETQKDVTYGEEIGELPEISTEARSGYEYAWFIGETRLNEDVVWEYTENKTAEAKETLIQYKVEFKAGGVTVATKYYTVEDTEIEEPVIPQIDGYTARWEEYNLDGGDKVVNAVYTEIQSNSSSSGSESSGSEDVDSCFAGINGLPMLGGMLLIAAAFVAVFRRKNA